MIVSTMIAVKTLLSVGVTEERMKPKHPVEEGLDVMGDERREHVDPPEPDDDALRTAASMSISDADRAANGRL